MCNFKISIIMGIYNCADTLDEAIQSILSQTYTNWQMILCDDASTDATYAVAQRYAAQYPEKFVLLQNEKNCGLNATLNRCLSHAKGDYIARMDGDDVSLPNRFAEEVNFLEAHLEYAIVSAQMEYFDGGGVFGRSKGEGEALPEQFMHGTPFCHAPCMVRRKAYEAVNGYTVAKKYLRVEDYELWVKMYAAGYKGYNLPNVLYRMRDDRAAVKRRKFRYRVNEMRVIGSAVNRLKLPKQNYVYALKPILVGLLPSLLYNFLHKTRLKGN